MEKNRYHSSTVKDLFRKIKSNCIALIFCLISFHSQAQTNVFSVSDGGFESGTTFTANGWTSVNAANGNRCWYVGTGQAGFSGSRAAFIGNSATTVGTNTTSRTVHIYRSVTFPANAGDITLTFKYKQGTLDETFDYTKVYLSSQTPTNGNLVTTGQIGGEFPGSAALSSFTTKTILIPDSCAGKTYNLIFTFNADAVTPHAYGAIDDIKLFYTPFTACSGTPNAGTATVTGTACAGNFATPVDLSLTGVSASTGLTYQWEVKPTGAASFTPITGGTTKNLSVIPPALGAKYRCVVTCTASGLGAPSAEVTVTPTSLPTVASLPFTEGFESWISSCGTNDRPSVNWTSSVVSGEESWRRNNQGNSASWTLASSGAYSPSSTVGSFSARFHSYYAANYGRLDAYVDCSTGASSKQLSFDYINTSGSDILDVFVSTDNGLTFNSVSTTLTTASSWTNVVIPFTSSNPITIVRLRALGDVGSTDIGVDNFKIITLTPCSGLPSPGNTLSSLAGACAGSTFSSVLSLQNESTLATTSGLNYQWQSSLDNISYNNIPSANARTLTITSATQNIYYKCLLTCTNSGSTSESTPYLFLAYPAPVLSIVTSAPAVCTAGPITMTASGANTYVWSPTTGLSSSNTASTVATVSADVTYTVTGTSANGCTSVLSKTLLFNPQISADQIVSSATNICGNSNTQLSVLAYSTLNYTMNGTTYNYLSPTGTETVVFSANDDAVSSSIALPFNFKYFGATQTSLFAYTNGFIQFGTSSGSTTSYSTVLPTAANPNNIIAGVWDDLNITSGGTVSYFTNGTSPNRVFVMQWQNVKFYNTAANNGNLSFQIQLYEKDNHAEVHIKELNDPVPSAHTVGLENSTGTKAITNSSRNNVSFSVALGSPEAWIFFPDTNNITYSWSPATYLNSTTVSNPQVVGINSSVNYTVTISGPAGCSQLTRNLLLNVLSNPSPKISPSDTTICSDQTIYLKVKDTGAYAAGYPLGTTVDWIGINNGLSPLDSVPSGITTNYLAKVILPNGCYAFSNTAEIKSRSIAFSSSITNVSCNGTLGKIVVINTSTTNPPYRYVWSDGTTILKDTISYSAQDSIQNLSVGQYYLSVYDNFGGALSCSSLNIPFVVSANLPFQINVQYNNPSTCYGSADGSIALNITNGVAPISYLWSTGSTLSNLNSLPAGFYTVTVTDGLGCVKDTTIENIQPQALSGNYSITHSCLSQSNGIITASPSGGNGGYTVDWYDINFDPILLGQFAVNGLGVGDYNAVLLDQNGCYDVQTISINEIDLSVSSFSPSIAPHYSLITLTGSGFVSLDSILINSNKVNSYSVIDNNTLELQLDNNLSSGLIQLYAGQCIYTTTDSLFVLTTYYADSDNDGFGNLLDSTYAMQLPIGYATNSLDCNDSDPNINPNISEVCNGIDDNCNSQIDDGLIFVTYYVDADGDGFGSTISLVSCSNPGAGYVLNNTDCNDNDIDVYTSSTLFIDVDGDGYDAGTSVQCYGATLPSGYIATTLGSDCNDNDILVYTSSSLYIDVDGDGYDAGTSVQCYGATLPLGYIATTLGSDCNDANANINPSVAEVCNGIDDNCNSQIDDGLIFVTYYVDADGDGFGSTISLVSCSNPGAGYVLNNTDCNDNDIDVYTSSTLFIDVDGDGYDAGTSVQCYGATLPLGYIATTLGSDCNDANANINPSVAEVCNGIDDNCDTQADEGLIFVTYYVDADGDGFGSTTSLVACSNPGAGYVLNNTDCNDNDIDVYTSSSLYIDVDGDGYDAGTSIQCYGATLPSGYIASTLGSDCNDNDNTVYTSSTLFIDADGDGYDAGTSVQCYGATLPSGYIATTLGSDCNDNDNTVYTSSTLFIDADGDGYDAGTSVQCYGATLPLGYIATTLGSDCNDANANINPSVAEVCNGIDDNCDTQADEGLIFVTYYVDADGDGFGSTTSLVSCSNPGAGYVLNNTDCNDNDIDVYTSSSLYIDADGDGYDAGTSVQCYGATLPSGYIATTLGSDCNDNDILVYTSSSLYIDVDGDGYDAGTSVQCYGATLPLGYIATTLGSDCNDANANINPSVAEVCNGIDDNCDTQADEGLIFTTYYVDADGDGFGSTTSLVACSNPGAGYVLNNTDCNDNDILVYTSSSLYIDADGDGYDAGTSVQCYGATLPSGYIATTLGSDCNDNDILVYTSSSLYIDADGDGYDAGTSVQCYGATLPSGYISTTLGSDCNDANANINPSVAEVCNGIDDNCDTQADEGLIFTTYYVDADGDGFGSTTSLVACSNPGAGYVLNNTDCNDNDILVYTSSSLYIDVDGDGYDAGTSVQCYGATLPSGYIATTLGSDCNDNDILVYTSSSLYIDVDGDGYDAGTSVQCYGATLPLGYIATTLGSDCNDANANINPSVAEVCNGIDDNCDTQADEGLIFTTYYVDADGDGFGSTTSLVACSNPGAGYVLNNTDCNDNDIDVYTSSSLYIDVDGDGYDAGTSIQCYGATLPSGYIASTLGSDCNDNDNTVYTSSTLFIDADGDGYDAGTSVQCYGATLPSGYIATTLGSDCNDNDNTVYTSSTLFIDADGDGYDAGTSVQCYGATLPLGYIATTLGSDCNDANANINPSVAEVCNGIDDNCDTQADEGLIFVTYYVDADGDGFGSTTSLVSCSNPGAGYVLNNTDCNDNDIDVYTSSSLYIDADGDGYDAGTSVQCYGATLPSGYIATTLGSDCNDNDILVYTSSSLYIDVDGDGYDAGTSVQCYGATLPLGYIATTLGSDCNDANANINPSVAEVCNGIDDNCDTQADEGLIFTTYYVDADGDGFGSTTSLVACSNPGAGYVLNNTDCNDNDILVYTSSSLYIDADGDGYDAGTSVQCYGATLPSGYIATTLGSDCNDNDILVYTSSSLYIDVDGDGYDAGTSVQCYGATLPSGYISTTLGSDCNDANANINPSVAEVCNGIDDNCDTQADEGLIFVTYYVDADGDGFGSTTSLAACSNPGAGYVLNNTDCNDNDILVYTSSSLYIDVDGDGYDAGTSIQCYGATLPSGYIASTLGSDCNDNDILVYTSSSLYIDVDGDGYDAGTSVQCYGATLPLGYIATTLGSDCNDANANINPSVAEVCNGIDDNCDTQADEGLIFTTYYVDADGDGFGSTTSLVACSNPGTGYVLNNTDCNDNDILVYTSSSLYIDVDGDGYDAGTSVQCYGATLPSGYIASTLGSDCNDANANVHPNATEVCNGIDDDCDTQVDENAFITSIQPSTAAIGATITLSGSGFTGITTILFGTIPASNFTVVDDNTITVEVPTGAVDGFITISNNICGPITSGSIFTVTPSAASLHLKVFIQGFYVGGGQMTPVLFNNGLSTDPNAVDSLTIELHDANSPYSLAEAQVVILDVNGDAVAQFPGNTIGNSYYVVVKHRNSIETWSKDPVLIQSNTLFDLAH